MSLAEVKAGTYKARAVAGKFGNSGTKGTPGVAVQFEFDRGDGKLERIVWNGWLTEKTMERTLESLAIAGYDENKGNLPDGSIPQDYFDHKAEVELVLDHEDYVAKDGSNKTALKVKWVNRPGGANFGLTSTESVTNALAGIDIKREMMVARQKLGLKNPSSGAPKNYAPQTAKEAAAPAQAPTIDTDEAVPF